MEPLSLREEARLVKEQLTGLALRRGVTVTLAGSEGQIVASKKIVAEILHNLTDNAIQYNRPGGSVTITVSESRDTATVVVQDTGIGIPKEELPAFLSASTGWTKATPGSWAAPAWGSPSSSTARSAWAPSSGWRAIWAWAPPSPCSSPRQERSNPLDTL